MSLQHGRRLDAIEAAALAAAKSGYDTRVKCPSDACTSRKNQSAVTLSVSYKDNGVLYLCHHCGAKGLVKNEEEEHANFVRRKYPRAQERAKDDLFGNIAPMNTVVEVPEKPRRELVKEELTEPAKDWLRERSLDPDAVSNLKNVEVFSTDAWFAELKSTAPAIGVGYVVNGEMNAAKIRSIDGKHHTQWGAARSFLGIDGVEITKEQSDIVIVEGEWDYLACAVAGVANVVSVPNGAPISVARDIKPSEDRKYNYLWEAREKINAASRVVIFCDDDNPGENLAEELSRRIGRAKCWRVVLPDGCKDANDIKLQHGDEELRKVIASAEPWPVSGLYGADHFYEQVDKLYEFGIEAGASTGFKCIDELYTVFPGQMTVVTGIPSSGKSEFIDQLMMNLAESSGWRFGIASFENEPRVHITNLISKRARAPFFPGADNRITPEAMEDAKLFVRDHFSFIHNVDGSMHDADQIIDRAKAAVMRYGIRGLVIDPYSYILRDRNSSETEFVSELLTKVRVFAQAYEVHVWFIAHPTKVQKNEDGTYKVPGGYDISGSAHWFAKADNGITIHRDAIGQPQLVEFHCWKVRYNFVGKQGMSLLVYDVNTRCYREGGDKSDIDWGDFD